MTAQPIISLDSLTDDSLVWEDQNQCPGPVPCEFLTGEAGTGKTFELKQRVQRDKGYGTVSATTGVAAVNLESVTVNTLLSYFDTKDLGEKYTSGRLQRTIRNLQARNLIIDEVSMMSSDQLDIIHNAVSQVNGRKEFEGRPIGIRLAGDFAQLAPVDADWAFEAECWPKYADKTTRLTKVWRQGDTRFLEALRLVRHGKGAEGVEALKECGVEFTNALEVEFDGTTIIPKNEQVARYNWINLQRVSKGQRKFRLAALRWGKQRREWLWDAYRGVGIPDLAPFCVGALVMILANDVPGFAYVNGDLGVIEETPEDGLLPIRLQRTDRVVYVSLNTRLNTQNETPEGMQEPMSQEEARELMARNRDIGRPWFSWDKKKWIVGGLTWFPIKLGYASTVHKTQGLTLDTIQIDIRNKFFGEPNMVYVALSRARVGSRVRIIGSPMRLAQRIRVHPKVIPWI